MAITVAYCGADMPWESLKKHGFRRRNTCLLQAFSSHPGVERVLVLNKLRRKDLPSALLKIWRARKSKEKVKDVYVCPFVVPNRSWFPASRVLNTVLSRLQIWLQTGSWKASSLTVWCYWPAGFEFARRLQLPGQWVFDADHNILADENESAGSRAELERVLQECGRRVQVTVAASRSILEWFEKNGSAKAIRLRNAVNPSRFDHEGVSTGFRSRRSGPPHIGYVGMLSRWIDFSLLEEVARRRPDWRITIAGRVHRTQISDGLKALPNVEFLDYLNPEAVPAYLDTIDVALGLYRRGAGSDVDSMKFFEYLAAGVPIVTTPYHDYLRSDFDNLLDFANTPDEFVEGIEKILNRSEAARREWEMRARFFARQNTWVSRANEVLNALKLDW